MNISACREEMESESDYVRRCMWRRAGGQSIPVTVQLEVVGAEEVQQETTFDPEQECQSCLSYAEIDYSPCIP